MIPRVKHLFLLIKMFQSFLYYCLGDHLINKRVDIRRFVHQERRERSKKISEIGERNTEGISGEKKTKSDSGDLKRKEEIKCQKRKKLQPQKLSP